MADKTEGKIILHIKHPLNDKQSRGLGMLFASCIWLKKGELFMRNWGD